MTIIKKTKDDNYCAGEDVEKGNTCTLLVDM
jgi:hypothetical protein